MKPKRFLLLFFNLLVIWLLLNNSLANPVLISGVITALILGVLLYRYSEYLADIRLTPKALLYSVAYAMVFLKELFMSNLDMAYRVLAPSLPIKPGIVEVKTRLQSKIGRLVLANSITLTPGTFTVDIIDNSLFIHWINVKSEETSKNTESIVRKFEKYLEVMYG